MDDFLSTLLNISVIVFAASSMLSVGLGNSLEDVLGPLRRGRAVIRALIANFLLVPLWAIAILLVLPVSEAHAVGLLVVAAAAGAPFLIKLAQMAGSDIALPAALLMLLLPVTVLYMPFVVPLASPDAKVNVLEMARPLLLTMLLPLAFGLFVRSRSTYWPNLLRPALSKVSTFALLMLIATTIIANFDRLGDVIFTVAILAAALLIAGAVAIGYLLGVDRATREVLALGTGQRNISAATVVATQSVGDPDTIVMVVAVSLVGFAILFPLAGWMRNRPRAEGLA